ncbi:azurin [Eikenella sp. S3360]|uniref:Azurin n=1 Tax=Eikenella glucosivorans TaxID=2766967 RepID=A0ABS0NAK4_9NEIS|nr:azurin [Eikenella glucosivorans]MBH5329327.1 azurin [Eikenella glucosivorans]
MKLYLPLIAAAALALAACGGETAQPPAASAASEAAHEQTASAASEAAPASEAAAVPAAAAEGCVQVVETGDSMQYNTAEISIPKGCTHFTVTLKHTGSMPKTSMGHNIVITAEGDVNGVNNDGIGAGPDNDYVEPGDTRVIAHTKLIGGGEESAVTFPVSKLAAGSNYKFFCTFPGHAGVMNGTVKLAE